MLAEIGLGGEISALSPGDSSMLARSEPSPSSLPTNTTATFDALAAATAWFRSKLVLIQPRLRVS